MSPAQQNIIRRALKVLNPFPPRFDLLQSSRPEYLKVTISTVKVHFDGKENGCCHVTLCAISQFAHTNFVKT